MGVVCWNWKHEGIANEMKSKIMDWVEEEGGLKMQLSGRVLAYYSWSSWFNPQDQAGERAGVAGKASVDLKRAEVKSVVYQLNYELYRKEKL